MDKEREAESLIQGNMYRDGVQDCLWCRTQRGVLGQCEVVRAPVPASSTEPGLYALIHSGPLEGALNPHCASYWPNLEEGWPRDGEDAQRYMGPAAIAGLGKRITTQKGANPYLQVLPSLSPSSVLIPTLPCHSLWWPYSHLLTPDQFQLHCYRWFHSCRERAWSHSRL